MAKFAGNVGFEEPYESKPGVWSTRIVERRCIGDVVSSFYNSNNKSESTNDELTINNRISIVANDYAFQNFQYMKYVVYMGVKWEISNVEVQYPRLVLSIGGVYNA